MPRAKPIEIHPAQGGKLMTGVSAETAGAANWTIKRDWRRDLEVEMRAEGYDLFAPNPAAPDQPPTNRQPITLIAMARRPNGQIAIVVGTQSTIWRYTGVSDIDWSYISSDYISSDYFAQQSGTWMQIGTGFSTNGRRWEAEENNGWLVLNNGVDLPVTYRVEDQSVVPMYELREQGVASVGTIVAFDGILLCMDVRIISDAALPGILNGPNPYGLITDDTIIDRFQSRVVWAQPNFPRRFAAIIPCTVNFGSNVVTLAYPAQSLNELLAANPGTFQVAILGAGVNGSNITATVVAVQGNQLTIGSNAITTAAAQAQLNVQNAEAALVAAQQAKLGTAATLVAAQASLVSAQAAEASSPSAANAAAVASASAAVDDATTADTAAATAITNAQTALNAAQQALVTKTSLQAADMNGAIAGQFSDLEGDGSAILKAKPLRQNVVIYKETGIFLGAYTGDVTNPFTFQEIQIPDGTALRHRDTLTLMPGAARFANGYAYGGAAHVYAGRNAFYRFDLTNQVPLEMPEFQPCQDLFFKAAKTGQVFAADNPITREVFFCFPFYSGPDKALRWDYRFGTLSTTALAISAACGIIRPEPVVGLAIPAQLPGEIGAVVGEGGATAIGEGGEQVIGEGGEAPGGESSPPYLPAFDLLREQWFVMGTPLGVLLRYGLVGADRDDAGIVPADNIGSNGLTITKPLVSGTVTASGSFFTERMVGRSIITNTTQTVLAIQTYISPTQVVVIGSGAVTAENFTVVPGIWHQAGSPYSSTLQSGAEAFGSQMSQKQLDRYSAIIDSNSVSCPMAVTLQAGYTPKTMQDAITVGLSNPGASDMIAPLVFGFYLGDRIIVSGINTPARLACRVFDFVPVNARGFGRSASPPPLVLSSG